MTVQLSFADRDNLLETIRRLSVEAVDVEYLLTLTCNWARALKPRFGFEHALLRNLTHLSIYLRSNQDNEDLVAIARGALKFIASEDVHSVTDCDSLNGSFGDPDQFRSLGKAFIASYAVHEIAVRLGEPVSYHPPAISKDEQARAEAIFEGLSNIVGCDQELLNSTAKHLLDLQNLADCGFLKRLVTNVRTLTNIVKDSGWPEDEKAFARGALRYFVQDEDLIHDGLGLVGYLDDVFILQLAVDLVSPTREPLVELLDKVVGVWPFINMLTLDDGSGPQPASEFTIINSALSCKNLRLGEASNTLLIAPETGPLAILLGIISTLGLAHEAGIRRLNEKSFAPGQKVLVDYEAIAEFDGFEDINGRRMFWLQKYNVNRGVKTRSRNSWPIADLHRLVPVDRDRKIQGEIDRGKRNQSTKMSGLSFLFNGPNKADVHAIRKQVIVVMPTTIAAEFCKSTLLYGQPIKDVMPVGQVSPDGETTERWSNHFGLQKPVLLIASDLDVARSYAEEHRDEIEMIVIDVAGRNREKHASIKRLNRMQIPCLLIATERIANETEMDQHNELSVWEWDAEDLHALVWPELKPTPDAGNIANVEYRIQAAASACPKVESIDLPIVGDVYKSFQSLRRMRNRRSENPLPELEEIVAEALFATTQLMRCATSLTAESTCVIDVRRRLSKICDLANLSTFLSDEERVAIDLLGELISKFVQQLQDHNPKAQALDRLLSVYPAATIFCPDARLIAELETVFAKKRNRVFGSVNDGDYLTHGLIVTGWFRQNRMASVLSPPIANPVVLLLYDVEQRWFQTFSKNRRAMRKARTRLKGRATIFPTIIGWKLSPSPTELNADTDVDDIEVVRKEIDDGFKQRIYGQVRLAECEAEVNARLVVFSGGAYGLFTDNYKLNIVSHLLDGSIADDEKSSVTLASSVDLRVGDRVVFRSRSRDLIREVADEFLSAGQRDLSGEWQRALGRYMKGNGSTVEKMCEQLRSAGCSLGPQAIRNWIYDEEMIGPLQYRTFVPAIAQVTGDIYLASNLDAVIEAIRQVRNAHQQIAPRVIAKRILEKAALIDRLEQSDHAIVHLEGDLIVVRVAEPASEPIPLKYALANRLIEGNSWHE